MWGRGLKPHVHTTIEAKFRVAPHVGAWIETSTRAIAREKVLVAPHVGAWIETLSCGQPYPSFQRRPPCGGVD